ncbi:hypothetical protein E3N88_14176 [Mikania micrantha]|uniref:Uncharacterized protein n=1 Tax=Mikania micrantha TaxID=192012 RepID=A0A5N6P3C1_9ASTR|nr:hypothetical protein E3N88_14176 [Mikania micrantha]
MICVKEMSGITSPTVYNFDRLNYIHMVAGKTWYAIAFEDVIRTHSYGDKINSIGYTLQNKFKRVRGNAQQCPTSFFKLGHIFISHHRLPPSSPAASVNSDSHSVALRLRQLRLDSVDSVCRLRFCLLRLRLTPSTPPHGVKHEFGCCMITNTPLMEFDELIDDYCSYSDGVCVLMVDHCSSDDQCDYDGGEAMCDDGCKASTGRRFVQNVV